MIHYHGLPITPVLAAGSILAGRHAMISFANPEQLGVAVEVCQSFCLDNGAFSAWRKGRPTDWPAYYRWVEEVAKTPSFDWAVIPDKIDGSEEENDALLKEWPHGKDIAMPVWHLHESLERLDRLCADWPRVAFGSSGVYRSPLSKVWKRRMNEVRKIACDDAHRPRRPFHLLRGLNPAGFTVISCRSGDSTTVARNIGIDKRWPEVYSISSKAVRGIAYATRLESFQSPPIWGTFPMCQENNLVCLEEAA